MSPPKNGDTHYFINAGPGEDYYFVRDIWRATKPRAHRNFEAEFPQRTGQAL